MNLVDPSKIQQKISGNYMVLLKRHQSSVFLTQIHIHISQTDGSFFHFFYQIHSRLMAKSHLIIGKKCEIMLDIIAAFWEIWLDIVLSTLFFEVFRVSFWIKITLDYRPTKLKLWLIFQSHFGEENDFRREGEGELKKYYLLLAYFEI